MDDNQSNLRLEDLDKYINLAIKKALKRHQKLGESAVVSEDGKLKIYTGDEIQILLDRYPDPD